VASVLGRRGADGLFAPPRLLLRLAWVLLLAFGVKWLAIDTLYWTFLAPRALPHGVWTLVNAQMLAGLVLAGGALVLRTVASPAAEPGRAPRGAAVDPAWILPAAAALVLWGLSFEVDRLLAQLGDLPRWLAVWNPWQLRILLWLALWGAGGLVLALLGRSRNQWPVVAGGWAFLVAATSSWLSLGTVAYRLVADPARCTPILNVQFATGALLAGMLAAAVRSIAAAADAREQAGASRGLRFIGLALIGLVTFWLGCLEIDRAYDGTTRLAALSAYWGLYGMALVMIGFARREAIGRYAGLGLLAMTVVKVLLIDMQSAPTMARVVSFLVCGLLLVGTSIAYARLAPRLLGREGIDAPWRDDPAQPPS
jgi:hypothetical protein